jgi:hypothetical protein
MSVGARCGPRPRNLTGRLGGKRPIRTSRRASARPSIRAVELRHAGRTRGPTCRGEIVASREVTAQRRREGSRTLGDVAMVEPGGGGGDDGLIGGPLRAEQTSAPQPSPRARLRRRGVRRRVLATRFLRMEPGCLSNGEHIDVRGVERKRPASSDEGAERACVLYSLIASCKLHGVNPFDDLRDVLVRVSEHPSPRRPRPQSPRLEEASRGSRRSEERRRGGVNAHDSRVGSCPDQRPAAGRASPDG